MKRSLCCLPLLFCILFADRSFAVEKKPAPASGEEAQAAARKWLDGLGMKGLVIEEKLGGNGFAGQKISGTTSYMYVLNQEGWYVNLGFSGKIEETTSLDELRAKFKYIALDRVITPGLKVPGWEVRPRTPVSSFRDGAEFVSFKDGRLTLKVKTKFFALYGRNPKVLVPADAPSPKGSYFQLRENFPLDLTLTAPLTNR